MAKGVKVPVSSRALIQRINRSLRAKKQVVKATRGEPARTSFGAYYLLDIGRWQVLKTNVDLEAFGRELGALKAHEELVEEDA
jgi:hypothetical protein